MEASSAWAAIVFLLPDPRHTNREDMAGDHKEPRLCGGRISGVWGGATQSTCTKVGGVMWCH